MKSIVGINPDSYCGIYCGACSVFMHGKTGCTDEFVSCLGSVPKSEIVCNGCKSEKLYAGCRVCSFRDCALSRGVSHCIDCAQYPCKMIKKWRSVARILPHVAEASSSLEKIKGEGLDIWLMQQKKRWSCPDCGAPLSWYASMCNTCGRKLESEAHKMVGWKRLLARLLLPIAYRKAKSRQGELNC